MPKNNCGVGWLIRFRWIALAYTSVENIEQDVTRTSCLDCYPLLGSFAAGVVYAATKEQKCLENCGVVMQEVLNIPDNLPQQVLAKAECVIVFPSVLKLAFGMGKDYGRGAMVCRTGKEFNGPWGAPAMYALEGDSIGMQNWR